MADRETEIAEIWAELAEAREMVADIHRGIDEIKQKMRSV